MNKTILFGDVEVNKKDFYDIKKAIPLNLVDVGNIVVSNKVKNNNETSKYFIGHLMILMKLVHCVLFYHK